MKTVIERVDQNIVDYTKQQKAFIQLFKQLLKEKLIFLLLF